jgi:hypothetical protein
MTGAFHVPQQLARLVRERASELREYCRTPQILSPIAFEIDHVVPRSRGGATHGLACGTCNGAKQARTKGTDPLTGRLAPLFNPRTQQWRRHFRWSTDFTHVVGKTAVGRATVAALNMNPPRMIQLRQLWVLMEVFPPNP